MDCEGEGQFIVGYKNPLLEEYVDCLHFILSTGLEKKKFIDSELELRVTLDIDDVDLIAYKDKTIEAQFNNLFLEVGVLYDTTHDNAYCINDEFESYYNIFSYFIGLGEMLGFTKDEIEQMTGGKIMSERELKCGEFLCQCPPYDCQIPVVTNKKDVSNDFIIYKNSTHDEDEMALYNVVTDKVIIKGDEYHDKINSVIEGFLMAYGIRDCEVEKIYINSDHYMFNKLGFWNENRF